MANSAPWLHQGVPDPCQPLAGHFLAPGDRPGRRWIAQTQRRSSILAAARTLTTLQDSDGVELQQVAARSHVAVQTIYNLVGNRTEVMLAAAEEWVAAIAVVARAHAAHHEANAAFSLLEMLWSSSVLRADYVGSAVRGNPADYAALRRRFNQVAAAAFLATLKPLREQGALRETVNMESLARQLASIANTTIYTWLTEPEPVDYCRELVNGPGLMLAGALQGEERCRLEHRLAEIS